MTAFSRKRGGGFGFLSTVSLRVAVMACGFLLTIITTRLITAEYGVNAYAVYAILVSLLASLPFADLGLGAGVVNAVSDHRAGRISRQELVTVLRSSAIILLAVSAIVCLISLALLVTESWTAVLAVPHMTFGDELSASLSLLAVAVSIPLGLGTRMLQGLQKTQVATALSFTGVGVQGLSIATVSVLHLPAWGFALGPALALVATNLVTVAWSLRANGLQMRDFWATKQLHFGGSYGLGKSAVPYLITILGVTLTLQLQRIFLSHVTNSTEVAIYSYVAQFSVAITSVVTLSSINLWPRFRDLQEQSRMTARILLRYVGLYAAVGVGFAIISAAAAYFSAGVVTAGSLHVPLSVAAMSGASILAWSLTRPAVMFLNTPSGFWSQAAWAGPCAAVGIGLTLALGERVGAAGAFAGSAASVLLMTFLPLTLQSLRLIKKA